MAKAAMAATKATTFPPMTMVAAPLPGKKADGDGLPVALVVPVAVGAGAVPLPTG